MKKADERFDKIMVPGHIEMAAMIKSVISIRCILGRKEVPQRSLFFENAGDGAGMFSEAEYNPVGSITRFDLSEPAWQTRHICFEGVEHNVCVAQR